MADPGTYLSHGDDAHLDQLVNDQGLDQVTASRMLWGAPRPEPKPADCTPPPLPPIPAELTRGSSLRAFLADMGRALDFWVRKPRCPYCHDRVPSKHFENHVTNQHAGDDDLRLREGIR